MKISRILIVITLVFLMQNIAFCQVKIEPLITVSKARNLPNGSVATICGTVTVASGAFASSIPFGYAIQDETAGIYVVDSILPMEGVFEVGDRVEITGTLSEAFGLITIKEISAVKKGKGIPIIAYQVNTGEINESTEGLLISTKGVIKKRNNDAPYGYKLFIDDGSGLVDIYINTTTNLLRDTSLWQINDTLFVTGFSSQYGSEYECGPRTISDIRLKPEKK